MALELYDAVLVVVGLAILGVGLLPRLVSDKPISLPILYVAFGVAVFSLPLGLPSPHPLEHGEPAERLAELGVILALMAAGLKLDRPPSVTAWESTWRLLGVTMPLTIAGAALLGWWAVGFLAPTAVLLGAVVAPTDPVLASEVQVEKPSEGDEAEAKEHEEGMEDEVRFALTSEAGLNDGLAFPFTYLAISVALVGVSPRNWFGEWLLVDVGYRIAVGVVGGAAVGWVLAQLVFRLSADTPLAKSMMGLEALAGTLLVYGLTELAGGYGFIAVFVAATVVRGYEREHEHNEILHDVAEKGEQLLMAVIMILFGGAIASGLLDPLTRELIAVAVAIVFLVRPLAGLAGLVGFQRDAAERLTIAFFGVRGIGSFYYLAYALNEAAFAGATRLWALVGLVVLLSIVVHGLTATPVVQALASREKRE